MGKFIMEITYAKKEDILDVIELWKRAGVFYEPEDRPEVLEKLLNFDNESIILAKDNENIVGSAVIVYNPFQTFVYRFSVAPDHQNKKIGQSLAEKVEETLKNKSMHNPTIFVEENNHTALDFWRKMGWKRLYKTYCLVKDLS